MQICQVTSIWWVTLASFYFQLHLRLSPVFTRILLISLAPATASIQICHQINYVCVCVRVCVSVCVCVCVCVYVCADFESIFQHIAIVQSFDAIEKHRKTFKKFFPVFYKIPFDKCNFRILQKNLLSNLTKWEVQK